MAELRGNQSRRERKAEKFSGGVVHRTKAGQRVHENTTLSVTSKKSDTASGQSVPRTSTRTGAAWRKKVTKWGKASMINFSHRERQTLVENTYKMAPDPDKVFDVGRVRTEMEEAIERYLDPVEGYRRESAVQLSRILAEDVKSRVKALGFARYKIVCHAIIGEKSGQGLQAGSRCVWDLDTDKMVSVTYHNKNLFAVVSVYGVYFE